MRKKESIEWFEVFTLVLQLMFGLFGFLVLAFAGLNLEFIFFFWFSAFYVMVFFNKRHQYKKSLVKSQFQIIEYRKNVIACFISFIVLIIIGVLHVLGNLKYPHFLLLDGWNNGYVIATRIAWLVYNLLLGFLSESFRVDSLKLKLRKQYGRVENKKIKIDQSKIFINTLLFPTISIPFTVLLCDFIGLTFVRDFITNFFLSSWIEPMVIQSLSLYSSLT